MKAILLVFSFLTLLCTGLSQDAAAASKTVTVTFYNNSSFSKKFSFISYAPGETGNGTVQVLLLPHATTRQAYKVGTKLYLADERQINIVMSGKKLEDTPFRIITATDDGAIINLKKEKS